MKKPQPGKDYNQKSPQSILHYALNLQDSSLRKELEIPPETKLTRRGKGGFGESVEHYYFGYAPNSRSEPDFDEADLELKVTPLKMLGKNQLVPKERLVITMVSYMKVVNETFETSVLYHKIKHVLLMHYLYEDDTDPFDYEFKLIHLWSIPAEDLPTIRADWELIVGKIRTGLAHELSGGDTYYLEAATKASDSTKTTEQPFSSIPARRPYVQGRRQV